MPYKPGEIISRDAMIEDRGNGEVIMTISSDTMAHGIWGREKLSHDDGAINLSRIEQGTAMMAYNHQQHPILGKFYKSEITADRKLRIWGKWDIDDPEVEPLYRKWQRGFMPNTSVRARINDVVMARDEAGEYALIRNWEFIHGSFVGDPEDSTVGADSSRRALYQPTNESELNDGDQMPPEAPPATPKSPSVDEGEIRRQAQIDERERSKSIGDLGKHFKNETLAQECIDKGLSLEESQSRFANHVLDTARANGGQQTEPPKIGLSHREDKQFSILRAIQASVTGDWSNAGLEKEVCQTMADIQDREFDPTRRGEIFIPGGDLTLSEETQTKMAALERSYKASSAIVSRASLASSPANIGELITEDFRSNDLITLGYETSLPGRLGVMMLRNLMGSPIRFPRQIAGLGFNWRTEQGAFVESNLGFNSASMTPKEFGGLFIYSLLAEHQAEIPMGLEAFARRDFARSLGQFYGETLLNATGATVPSPQPLGLLNTAGYQTIATRPANGGEFQPEGFLDLQVPILRTRLVDRGDLQVLTSPEYCTWLFKQRDGNGRNIWLPGDTGTIANGMPSTLWNMPVVDSTIVPNDLTKGTGTNLTAALMGPFMYGVIMGEWYSLRIDTSMHYQFETGQEAVRVAGTCDIINRLPDTFGIINDIATPA